MGSWDLRGQTWACSGDLQEGSHEQEYGKAAELRTAGLQGQPPASTAVVHTDIQLALIRELNGSKMSCYY